MIREWEMRGHRRRPPWRRGRQRWSLKQQVGWWDLARHWGKKGGGKEWRGLCWGDQDLLGVGMGGGACGGSFAEGAYGVAGKEGGQLLAGGLERGGGMRRWGRGGVLRVMKAGGHSYIKTV